MRWLPLVLLGCASVPRDLGRVPEDAVRVRDVSGLAHLGEARGDDPTVAELLRRRPGGFTSAPDPTAALERLHAQHSALPPLDDFVELTVLTYNVALLSRTYLGTLVESPDIDERREVMAERVFATGDDVLLLQEVWELEDARAFEAAGERAGYAVWSGTGRKHVQHGLVLAVRLEHVAGGTVLGEAQYASQRKLERWPGPNVKRGWLSMGFDLAGTSRRLTVVDTHATSYASFWRQRDRQARELGMAMAGTPGIVVLGGDLNSGPYYAREVWLDGEGKPVRDWWDNAVAWSLWQHYGGAYDALAAATPAADVQRGDAVPETWERYLEVPYGEDGWCDTSRGEVFTGTDCNSLYWQQYSGTEPPARLDHVMVRDPERLVRVVGAGVVLTETEDFGGPEGPTELSDHYGVRVRLRVAR